MTSTQATLMFDAERVDADEGSADASIDAKLGAIDWRAFECDLTRDGYAVLPEMLAQSLCREVADYFPQERRFRSRIVMERYAFGRGEYKYFARPLPDIVGQLRDYWWEFEHLNIMAKSLISKR